MYSVEEVFTLAWQTKTSQSTRGEVRRSFRLVLEKVKLVHEIHTKDNKKYRVIVKEDKKKPWLLGIWSSLAQAKQKVYYHIIEFRLYETGQWRHWIRVPAFERYKYHLLHLYPATLVLPIQHTDKLGMLNLYQQPVEG